MPVKILLADKSITIQKVVEMLFSGRDFEVVCVSDGETALNEAVRIIPDIVLADVDLPRIDGYKFSERLKNTPKLTQTPVILMMSRDDVYDSTRGKQAGIIDNIAKPFESQELIGKVKKALAAVPSRTAEPTQPAAQVSRPAVTKPLTPITPLSPAGPKQSTPSDIFDIIQAAPSKSDIKQAAAPMPADMEESVYEVEPEVEEVEEPLAHEIAKSLPIGEKAVEEMRAGLGFTDTAEESVPEIMPFESFEFAMETTPRNEMTPPAGVSPVPPAKPMNAGSTALPENELRKMAEATITKMAKELFANMSPPQPPTLSASELWGIAEETIAKMAKDMFAQMPPIQPPKISEDMVRSTIEDTVAKMAKELFQKVPPPQPPQVSEDTIRTMVEDRVSKIANEVIKTIRLPEPPQLPESEIRSLATATISRMAADAFKDMPPPPLPKISDETVRRGLEEVLSTTVREMAREMIERVAWEVIPELAEHLIKDEIERLKAME